MFNTSNPLRANLDSIEIPEITPGIRPAIQREWKGWQVVLLIFASMVVLGGIAYGGARLAQHVWNVNPMKAGMITASIELGILGAAFIVRGCRKKLEEREGDNDNQPLAQGSQETPSTSSNENTTSMFASSSKTTLLPSSSADSQGQMQAIPPAPTTTSLSTQQREATTTATATAAQTSKPPLRDPNEPYRVAQGVDINGFYSMDIFYDPVRGASHPDNDSDDAYFYINPHSGQNEYESKRHINFCIESSNRQNWTHISLL